MEEVNQMDIEFLQKILEDLEIGLVTWRDYLPIHKKRLERYKVLEDYITVEKWWKDLDSRRRQEVMEEIYPDKIIDSNEGWRYLDLKIKVEIYNKNNS